ncbi:hypothetical protein F7Q99_33120 [Streptomyces kaniharaensis]|uniref:Uncharacterized protein n=1 Tax=Streptomyces kaniharaensis TaxID=212423 RepID=A0A6N7KZS0_9ACTN|nr:hypothetical protein [Streptomyces kaniharaensis]MQS16901.1 hypothetical protein [Streptomyces kaniharaensis]
MRTGERAGGLGRLIGAAAELGEAGRQAVLRGGRAAVGGRWALTALTSVAPPPVPATEPWKLSVGTLIGRHPLTPAVVHKLLGLLDGLGAVHLGPTKVGFDGEEIEWDKVVEIRTCNAFEVLTTTALEHEVDRIREFLPPVPGRKWVVTKAGEALATVVLAALERGSVDQRLDELTVPTRIVHRGLLGRQRTLDTGSFAAATLVVAGQVGESLIATARSRGIPVRPAEQPAVPAQAARVVTLRERTDSVARLLSRIEQSGPEAVEAAAPQPGVSLDKASTGTGRELNAG